MSLKCAQSLVQRLVNSNYILSHLIIFNYTINYANYTNHATKLCTSLFN